MLWRYFPKGYGILRRDELPVVDVQQSAVPFMPHLVRGVLWFRERGRIHR